MNRHSHQLACTMACAFAMLAEPAQAQAPEPTPASCAPLAADGARLSCYDQLFRHSNAPASATSPATPAEAMPAPRQARETQPLIKGPALVEQETLTHKWDLTDGEPGELFTLRTYESNYLLPLHDSSNINRAPSSPTRSGATYQGNYRPLEAKFQLSLRAKMADNLLLPYASLWFAYTQQSLWQVWNRQDSAPFRSTDYQPEAIYVVPVPDMLQRLPADWRWRMVQLAFAHQSNGQSNPLSRSWNRVYAGLAFDRGPFALQLRAHHRLKESSDDDNPDLTDYIGNAETTLNWVSNRSAASLTWRTNAKYLGRGSVKADWSYPVDSANPAGLRWNLQVFSGYGETLLDYNHRQTSVGVGFKLF